MLRFWHPVPLHSLWRRLFFPIYARDQLKILLIPSFICIMILLLSHDLYLFSATLIVLVFGFLLVMSSLHPYVMNAPASSSQDILDILDESQHLVRQGKTTIWRKRNVSSLISTNLDKISLTEFSDRIVIIGRLSDLRIITQQVVAKSEELR